MKNCNCLDCGKRIWQGSKRCWPCYIESHKIKFRCEYCGKEFKKSKAWLNLRGYKGKYCSIECRDKWRAENKTAYKKYNCSYCGKQFLRHRSQITTNDPTCSRKCNRLLHSQRGTKSIFYIDGRTPLRKLIKNSHRYNEWQKSVYARDNYRCMDCGSDKNIHAHHIKPFCQLLDEFMIREKGDRFNRALNDKKLWSVKNGITLCKKCHSLRHPEINLMNTIGRGGKERAFSFTA